MPYIYPGLCPGTSKPSVSALCTQVRYKIRNHNWGNYKLAYTGAFGKLLRPAAYIADNGMDLSTIARIHGRQLAHQALNCHAGSGKDIAGMGYLFSPVSGFR